MNGGEAEGGQCGRDEEVVSVLEPGLQETSPRCLFPQVDEQKRDGDRDKLSGDDATVRATLAADASTVAAR